MLKKRPYPVLILLCFIFQLTSCSDGNPDPLVVADDRGLLIAKMPHDTEIVGWVGEDVILKASSSLHKISYLTNSQNTLVEQNVHRAQIANNLIYYHAGSSIYKISVSPASVSENLIDNVDYLGLISRDGSMIAYYKPRDTDIHVIDTNSGHNYALPMPDTYPDLTSFSPDNAKLLYRIIDVVSLSGYSAIAEISSANTTILDVDNMAIGFYWEQAGLFYCTPDGSNIKIMFLNFDTGNTSEIETLVEPSFVFEWSPGGTKVAYCKQICTRKDNTGCYGPLVTELWIYDLHSKQSYKIATVNGDSPDRIYFSPDGNKVIYKHWNGKASDALFYVVNTSL